MMCAMCVYITFGTFQDGETSTIYKITDTAFDYYCSSYAWLEASVNLCHQLLTTIYRLVSASYYRTVGIQITVQFYGCFNYKTILALPKRKRSNAAKQEYN